MPVGYIVQTDFTPENDAKIEIPAWVNAVELCPPIQEKKPDRKSQGFAVWTCDRCPQPRFAGNWCICTESALLHDYPFGVDLTPLLNPVCKPANDLNPAKGCGRPFQYTRRCRGCDRKAKRGTRRKTWVHRLERLSAVSPNSQLVMVTPTMPNFVVDSEADIQDAMKQYKVEVTNWLRTVGPQSHFAGSLCFYEYTTKPHPSGSGISVNAHAHILAIRTKYWAQADVQTSWNRNTDTLARGIIHITNKIRGMPLTSKKGVRYATKYATKQSSLVRTESYGLCRPRAWSAFVESHHLLPDFVGAGDASD